MAVAVLERAREVLADAEFTHDGAGSGAAGRAPAPWASKPGQMFQPIRVAVCGRKNAPPLFETLAVLGRETLPETDRPGHRIRLPSSGI